MLQERIKKELKQYEDFVKAKGIEYVYDTAYYIAIMHEFEYLFTEFYEAEDVDNEFSVLNKIEGNICETIMNYYLEFRHPERYCPFNTESLLEIIEIYIDENGLKEG